MMCAGIYSSGKIPDYPGLKEFKGQILHSGQFRGGKEFEDKTMVVVGTWIFIHDHDKFYRFTGNEVLTYKW